MGKNDESDVPIGDMASMAMDLPTLKTQRSTMKRNISKLKIKVEKEGSSSDYTIIKCRLQILESYFTHISHIQTQIERLDPSDESRSDLEELFIHAKALMVDLLDKKRRCSEHDQSMLNVTTSSFSHQNRLPQLKLPRFDGKYSEYSRFISTFTTLVHEDSCIPTIDKFNYLLNCLSGQALAVVEPYPVIDENYKKALDRLKERYDNKSLIFIDHVNSLFSITPINKPNATALRSILDNVAALRSSLLSLGSELDVMNAIIIHIVLSKIDSESKEVYDEKQEFKNLPSWDDCYSILCRRCQFLESRKKEDELFHDRELKPKNKLRHLASSFVTSNILCEYCQSKYHYIGSCNSYLSLPVTRRFDYIKVNSLCINCLRKGHMVSKCTSKSRCRTCRISHHSSLHNPYSQHTLEKQNAANAPLQQNSSLSYDTKFPALLPKDHRFTKLYIKYLHLKHLHAGPKALLAILRQHVWVINARDVVRQTVRNCIHCFKYKPHLMQQVMGDLPANRLKAQRPFLVCGVDFCGPFYTSYRIKNKLRHLASSFVTSNILCEYCQSKDHYIGSCNSYLSLPVTRRFDYIKVNSLCINCLRKGHMVSKCTSKSRCRTCRISHHSSLHNPYSQHTLEKQNAANAPLQQNSSLNSSSFQLASSFQPSSSYQARLNQQPSSSKPSNSTASIHVTTNSSLVPRSFRRIILPTAVVFVRDIFGTFQPLRALLDSCSEVNLITQEAVSRLRLKQTKSIQDIAGVSDIRAQLKYKVTATIKSRITDFEHTSTFSVTKSISSHQPSGNISSSNWGIPDGLELADPLFYLPQRIDLLLSSEIFFSLLLDGRILLGEGIPCLINTALGWIVGGKINSEQTNEVLSCNVITEDQDLNSILKSFWEIEEFSQMKSFRTEEETQCEQHFIENTVFDQNRRVKVRLPFRNSINKLGYSFENARRRFIYLETRLQKNELLKKMYIDFMTEYINLGHMSVVSNEVLHKPHYVIPHHSVLRPQSSSTKLRVVFDASARTSSNISLNETLMVGPIIQQELIITMLSFRLHKYAMSADICKMYRQFLVDERDRDFQLVLWRDKIDDPIKLYQLNTVTYGTSAAPFLAIRSLWFIADNYKKEFPIGAQVLKQDLYVDDLLTGAPNLTELFEIKNEIIQILEKCGLTLSKWNSNSVKSTNSNKKIHLKTNNENITKALGMSWKPAEDVFCFRFDLPIIEVPTKRSVLSTIARIFDVLGMLSPIVISCKILIQEMWKRQIDWDTPLTDKLKIRWIEIESSLSYINLIEVPRFVQIVPNVEFDIHGFADASQLAYGCCLYIRVAVSNGFRSTLLIAKSKVAPVVQQSLPRLELCAALLLSRTWAKIKFKFENSYKFRTFFWSDSKIVLSWLKNHSSTYVCFVANRVSEIQNTTNKINWRHVPSKQNPADVVSRGCLANELISTMWFSGPDFLTKGDENWPKSNNTDIELPSAEMRKSSFKTTINVNSIIAQIIINQSSYLRILHIIAYIHRLFNKSKRNSFITAEELQLAFWKVVHDIQTTTFKDDIDLLRKQQTLKPSLQKLSPFLHEVSSYKSKLTILRVGGRLANSSLSYDTKFPALLPKDHRFTKLYIKYLHLKHLHAGPKALLAILRQHVWVINARDVVRQTVRNCIHCFKYKPHLMQQVMGDLPANRLKAQRPFLVCGVDFCGPFYTSYRIRGKPPYKTYVAIFICFASKAIHTEVVSDLSTNNFLLCLKRFIGRRGIPQRIYCDNATNFVGANSKLNELKRHFFEDSPLKDIMNYSEVTGFEFSFIPPRSPHFGGLWESAVKSTKKILVKNISQAGVTYEELQTILIEIEAILNSRPLAPRSDDPNDGEALTPAHLLIGSSLLALPDENLDRYKNINYLKRWQLVTYLKQQFWQQWVHDYVLTLQQKAKWFKSHDNIEEGRLVIVHEDNLPPQQWLLARIVKTIPGRDGKIRVVDLRTTKGIFRRSIHKIAPLPVDEAD